jgi:hypothetical protein
MNGQQLMSRRHLVRNETDCADVATCKNTLGVDRADDLPGFLPPSSGS